MPPKPLLLTYYWPPSGGAGVQRWLKLSHYLAEAGLEVHVLTLRPEEASYPHYDESLLADVHPRVTVHRTGSFEPLRLYARLTGRDRAPAAIGKTDERRSWKADLVMRLRTHLFRPDPRKYWRRYARPRAEEIVSNEGITHLITTSPPHSVQLIGRDLKRRTGLPWIADLRDPWTDIYYYDLLLHSRLTAALDKRMERSVLRGANRITTVSEGLKKLFLASVPERAPEDVVVIPNGYDPRDFPAEAPAPVPGPGFRVVFTGMLAEQLVPGPLFRALAAAKARRPAAGLRLEVVGTIADGVLARVRALGLEPECVPTVPHSEVIGYQRGADLLLLPLPQVDGGEGILSGKLFEYLAAGPPIMALGRSGYEVGRVLKETGRGRLFTNEQTAKMTAWIVRLMDGEEVVRARPEEVRQYGRDRQAQAVLRLLERTGG